ncbi:hypothetical protein [Saliphagus infecundisoli]|uniref:Uncharacterized protein n=1 Tax=Saliphagus infecundisoli TaxID=1849069 RepID=A0ABD5Q9K8_9EURY|nr:hypothetical protein [Saliphagus infecundisoli]
MDLRGTLLGDHRPRVRATVLAIALPVVASAAFLLEYDAVLGVSLLYPAVGVALYTGWIRAGALTGAGAVFLVILWRFVVPPLVGYWRWSMDTRYTPPRLLAYKLTPRGELIQGLTHGPIYALAGTIVLGGAGYLVGSVGRRLRQPTADANS